MWDIVMFPAILGWGIRDVQWLGVTEAPLCPPDDPK
jgi:hypothetical protein